MNGERLPRYRTGDQELDQELVSLLDDAKVLSNRDLIFESMVSIVRMAHDDADRLNLKIVRSALKEMREAFRIFEPYQETPKVTMFGSARTRAGDPEYIQAKEAAAQLAEEGWMVATGAGPGVMAAGLEGAGRANSIGISIRLPFEQRANDFILRDPKLVEMKYFFTRKLMLIKDSDGFIVLPGGYGTLDELFELLTLLQTGKADPVPISLLHPQGSTFWHGWQEFVDKELSERQLISTGSECLYLITDSVEPAIHEIMNFYRNYHSRRFVDGVLIMRLKSKPNEDELIRLSSEFSDILSNGWIQSVSPSDEEIEEDDEVDLPRIAMNFNKMSNERLRQLIDVLNHLDSAPKEITLPNQRPSQK